MFTLGIVNSYDPNTQTAEVTSFDGSRIFYNATALMQSCDPKNGAYDSNPPAVGAPCLIGEVNGENVILGYYSPPTLGGDNIDPMTGDETYIDRSRVNYPKDTVLPGEKVTRTPSGCEQLIGDKLFGWKMSDALYMFLNMVGNMMNVRADRIQFSAPGADILIDVSEDKTTNIKIRARTEASEEDGVSAMEITFGKLADVYNVKVYDQQFIHVDKDRNVEVRMKTMTIIGDTVNMEQCSEVLLPL